MPLSSDGNPSSTLYLLSAYRQRACAQAWADGSSPCGRAAAVHSGLHRAPLCCSEFRRLHSKRFIKCTSQRSSVAWDDINNSGRGFQHFQRNGGLEQTGEHKAGSLSQTDLLVSTVFLDLHFGQLMTAFAYRRLPEIIEGVWVFLFCCLKKQTCQNETISRIDSASVHRCQLHPSGQSAASVEGDVTYNVVEGEKENNGRVTVCTDEYCVVVTVLLCFSDSCIS